MGFRRFLANCRVFHYTDGSERRGDPICGAHKLTQRAAYGGTRKPLLTTLIKRVTCGYCAKILYSRYLHSMGRKLAYRRRK